MPDMLFEAVREGVMRRSVIGTFAYRPEWIKVLRPRKPLPPNHLGLTVADYAEALYGRGYSRRGAVASRFPVIGAAGDGAIFCSQAIAHAYAEYGVDLVPGKTPSQIYPALLLTSVELEDVTESCVRELGSVSNEADYQMVIDTASQEAPGAEMKMNRRVFQAVQRDLGSDIPAGIHSLTELSIWLSHNYNSDVARKADERIVDIFEREGMFRWYEQFSAEAIVSAQMLEFAATAAEASVGEPTNPEIKVLLDDLRETMPLAEGVLERRKATAQDYDGVARTTALSTFGRLASVYRKQYEDAVRIHKARRRLIDALGRRPG
jgi:hypothetical protein